MYKNRITFTGPADKLIVNNRFYKLQFLDPNAANSHMSQTPGFIVGLEPVLQPDGSVVRDIIFDTEENALAALAATKAAVDSGQKPLPDACYTLGYDAMKKYEADNGIKISVTTIEVTAL